MTGEKQLIAGGNNSRDEMSCEKVSDLYISGMQESRAQSVHFALRGTHATAWGDAGSAEASSFRERRLLMCY